jgi:hypothetical protein
MWRRVYRDVQTMIEEALVRSLGQSWRGGKLDGASISGTHQSGGILL